MEPGLPAGTRLASLAGDDPANTVLGRRGKPLLTCRSAWALVLLNPTMRHNCGVACHNVVARRGQTTPTAPWLTGTPPTASDRHPAHRPEPRSPRHGMTRGCEEQGATHLRSRWRSLGWTF